MTYNPPINQAGYCSKHRWPLSYAQIKCKGCISRSKQRRGKQQCSWFRKNAEHPVWEQRRRMKREAREA